MKVGNEGILIVGGGLLQIPAIKKAKQLGVGGEHATLELHEFGA